MDANEFGTAIVLYLVLTRNPEDSLRDSSSSQKGKDLPPSETGNDDEYAADFDVLPSSEKGNNQNLEVLWSQFNSLLESLVGFSNCVNFLQLGMLFSFLLNHKSKT